MVRIIYSIRERCLYSIHLDFLKNDILKQIEKSKEYNIAKKILGYKIDAIIEKIVDQRANEIFLNSERRINEIVKNPHILFGYQNRSKLYIYNHIENPSDASYIFFENRGEHLKSVQHIAMEI